MIPSLYAEQHVRRMRGGSQAHLVRASDGAFYVVKFQNNPQSLRVLANEMFATQIGLWLGLPTVSANCTRLDHSKPLGWAEIRHPFHPLRGQRFPVLKTKRTGGVDT